MESEREVAATEANIAIAERKKERREKIWEFMYDWCGVEL